MRRAILPILATGMLFAGGEYDKFHVGPRLGLTWSPGKNYGSLGSPEPGTDTLAEGKMQLGLTGGLSFTLAAVPGKYAMELDVDFIRTLHKESGSNLAVKQNIVRGELRSIFSSRGNTNEGMAFFISPTYSKISTSLSGVGEDLSEKRLGGALGLLGTTFHETYYTTWEVGAYYLPKLKSGTEAGGLTIELRMGYHF